MALCLRLKQSLHREQEGLTRGPKKLNTHDLETEIVAHLLAEWW